MRQKVALALAFSLAACAEGARQAEQRDDLLARAGFQSRTADSAPKIAFMKALPPHKFVVKTINGKPVYLYADPLVCRCVYFGKEDNWGRYQRALFNQKIAAQHAETSQLYKSIEYNGDDWGYF